MLWTAAFGKPGGNAARRVLSSRMCAWTSAHRAASSVASTARRRAWQWSTSRRRSRWRCTKTSATHVGGHLRGELARVEGAAVVRAVRARDEGDEHALHGDAAPPAEGRDGRERPPPVPAHDVRRQRDIWVHLVRNQA